MMNQGRLMILVTENCNLKCSYCYEHQKNSKKMTFETAKAILDDNLKKADANQPIVIELFGGEAFVNFRLIKEIDEYVNEKYSHLDIK